MQGDATGSRMTAIAVALGLAVAWPAGSARACGIFVPAAPTEAELARTLPYLSRERALVVWDRSSEIEDFVREVRFDQASAKFGFVVPVPSQPEVSAVEGAHGVEGPFDLLARRFPFLFTGGGALGGSPRAGGARPLESPASVNVVSRQRVGSFTAFVLQATETGGLRQWLTGNGFDLPDAARGWLDHYVHLGFWYVAMRYEPSADALDRGMTSQTARIRFKTPVAYYPYSEPALPVPDRRSARLLDVWVVSKDPVVPVAARTANDGSVQWLRPWEGAWREESSAELAHSLPSLAQLLPRWGKVYVETFRDAKITREGWGDTLLVRSPIDPPFQRAVGDDSIAEDWPLLAVLDPRLEGHVHDPPAPAALLFPPSAASSDPVFEASSTLVSGEGGGCHVGSNDRGDPIAGFVAMLLVSACRRGARRRSREAARRHDGRTPTSLACAE